tara:strand:- start:881 stop:1519 length:639 start_codon:yes stop_codon:yes gene_type:complete
MKIFKFYKTLNLFKTNDLKKAQKALNIWLKQGSQGSPPHIVKSMIIMEYQKIYNANIFIETGTFKGDMVDMLKYSFKKLISIELGVDLFKNAKKRFINDNNVFIKQGDSGYVLPNILLDVNETAIFWLDGHYSAGITARGDKDCPIFMELDAIFQNQIHNHIILIDDARYFNGTGDWPSINKLTEYVKTKNEHYKVEIKHDIIRFVNKIHCV